MPKIDSPEVPVKKFGKTFVTIPAFDLFDHTFASIRINNFEFLAGQTYELDEPLASTVKERVRLWERANVRLLQPTKDKVSESQIDFSKGHATGSRNIPVEV